MEKEADKDIAFTYQLLLTLTLAISSSKDIDTALLTILQKICETTGWAAGDAWFVILEKEKIKLRVSYCSESKGIEEFCRQSRETEFSKDEGLPGLAWARKNAVWVKNVQTLAAFPRKEVALRCGIRSGMSVPVPLNGEVIAVLAFYLVEESEEQKNLVQLVTAVAGQIGALLKQKQTEEMLKNSEMRFRSLMASSPEAIFIAKGDGEIIMANNAAGNMFGYKCEEFIGRKLEMLMPEKYRERHKAGMERYKKTHVPLVVGRTIEVEGLRKDDSVFPIELSIGAWVNDDTDYFSGIIRDITIRKEAEQKILQKQRDLEQFAYVASHDLKEPLRMISSYTRLLIRKCEQHLDEESKEFGVFIDEAVVRMQALINDLLAYGRVGGEEMEKSPVNITQILDGVKAGLRIKIDETDTLFTYENMPIVMGNHSQLNQLFQNLIENAIKFRSRNSTPQIKVEAQQQGQFWLFSVADNGIGMEQQSEDRVFKIFQRLHSRSEYAGTGIGLAICKKIVENHDGKIWFKSAPEQGAVFYFTLPAV